MPTRGSGGEAPGEELGAPLLLDAGKGWPAGHPTETPGDSMDKDKDDTAKMVAERATKFTVRGLLILLWVYLFDSMREYAIKYTGGDVLFSTFAAIVVAVPIAEILSIIASLPIGPEIFCCDSEEVDLEKGPTSGHTTAPMPADAMTRAAIKATLDMAAKRMTICVVRGLLVLLWLFLVDLMRIYFARHDVGVELFTMTPLLIILATGVSTFLCFLMYGCGEFVLHMLSNDGELQ